MEERKPKGLKMMKVRDLEDRSKYPPLNPILPQPPFLLLGIGSVRCLFEYSLVETKTGNKYIKDVKIGDKVNSDEGFVNVINVINQGVQLCYKIILNNNMELILTNKHQIQTKQGLLKLEDITDEEIITIDGQHKIKSKEEYGKVNTFDLSVLSENNLFYCNQILVKNSGKTNALINMMRQEPTADGDGMYGTKFFSDNLVISNTIGNDSKARFLTDAFRVEDHYENRFVDELVESQKKYPRGESPTTLLILDDIISKDFKKTTSNSINSLATRFRHYEISIMIFTQSFRSVSNIIRSNSQNVMVFRQQSSAEYEKIASEYADLCGSEETFHKYYDIAHSEPYGFLYIDGQQNPAKFYKSFEELIGIGDKLVYTGSIPQKETDLFEKENKKKK